MKTSSNPNQEIQQQNLRRKRPTEDPNAAKKESTENKHDSAASSRI